MAGQQNLRKLFQEKAQNSASTLPCAIVKPDIGMGEIYIFEANEVKEPANDDRIYGLCVKDFYNRDEDEQEEIKAAFVAEQKAILEDAFRRTGNTYEDHAKHVAENFAIEMMGDLDEMASAELLMAKDRSFIEKQKYAMFADHIPALNLIEEGKTAKIAAYRAYMQSRDGFRNMDDPYFAGRAQIVQQVLAVFQRHMDRRQEPASLDTVPEESVLVVDSLTPADLFSLINKKTGRVKIRGIICTSPLETMTSHTAILAKALRVPYAIMSKENAERLNHGDFCVIDGHNDVVHFAPDSALEKLYRKQLENEKKLNKKLAKKSKEEEVPKTRAPKETDREEVRVHANFDISYEAAAVRESNPSGIGLYRTEMADDLRQMKDITEEQWYNIFKANMQASYNTSKTLDKSKVYKPTVFRTLDCTADKIPYRLKPEDGSAPDPVVINEHQDRQTKVQIEALLKLNDELVKKGHHEKVKVMIPGIARPKQLREWQNYADDKAKELGVTTLKLGAMAEVPGLFDKFAALEAGFISVGTNDLIAAELRSGRYDGNSEGYDPIDCSVLKKLKQAIDYGKKKDIPVSICGDMASDPCYTAVLIGLGYRDLSTDVGSVKYIKDNVGRINIEEAQQLVEVLSKTESSTQRRNILNAYNETRVGIYPDGWPIEEWEPPAGKLDMNALVQNALKAGDGGPDIPTKEL